MAFSFAVDTHGLLNRWQVRMQESIWNYNQIEDSSVLSFRGVYLQQEREIIARALASAFELLRYLLGYYPQPTYVEDQQITLDPERPWWNQTLNLGTRHLVSFGRRAVEHQGVLLQNNPRLDFDGDAFPEIAEWRLDSLDIDPSEIRLFLRVEDYRDHRSDIPALPQFEVPVIEAFQPHTFSPVVVFHVHYAEIVRPSKLDDRPRVRDRRNALDRRDYDIYVHNMDMYTVHTNPVGAVKLLSYRPDSSEVIETEVEPLILNAFYSDFKLIRGNQHIEGKPYAIKASYLAGYPQTTERLMDSELETAIIRLANTDMILHDLPLSHRSEEFRSSDIQELFDRPSHIPREFINPLGTRRGHIEAWNVLRRYIDPLVGRPEG